MNAAGTPKVLTFEFCFKAEVTNLFSLEFVTRHIGSSVCISISVSRKVLFLLDLFPGLSQLCSASLIDPHFLTDRAVPAQFELKEVQ